MLDRLCARCQEAADVDNRRIVSRGLRRATAGASEAAGTGRRVGKEGEPGSTEIGEGTEDGEGRRSERERRAGKDGESGRREEKQGRAGGVRHPAPLRLTPAGRVTGV